MPDTSKGTRFYDRIEALRGDPDECWLWNGYINPGGYGRTQLRWKGRMEMVHRLAYEHFVGPIPEGMTLDHLCRVRHCFNPNHLDPVDLATNISRGEGFGPRNTRKTHCVRGHPYDDKNTRVGIGSRGKRQRYCRACKRITEARRSEQNKAYIKLWRARNPGYSARYREQRAAWLKTEKGQEYARRKAERRRAK